MFWYSLDFVVVGNQLSKWNVLWIYLWRWIGQSLEDFVNIVNISLNSDFQEIAITDRNPIFYNLKHLDLQSPSLLIWFIYKFNHEILPENVYWLFISGVERFCSNCYSSSTIFIRCFVFCFFSMWCSTGMWTYFCHHTKMESMRSKTVSISTDG